MIKKYCVLANIVVLLSQGKEKREINMIKRKYDTLSGRSICEDLYMMSFNDLVDEIAIRSMHNFELDIDLNELQSFDSLKTLKREISHKPRKYQIKALVEYFDELFSAWDIIGK